MKKKLLLLFALVCTMGLVINAQHFKELTIEVPGIFPGQTIFSHNDFSVCGEPITSTFRVHYNYCPLIIFPQCAGGCGANPYKFTVRLYRNGQQIASSVQQASQAWGNFFFYNVTKAPGEYTAHVKLERRKGFLCLGGYETVTSGNTNDIDGIQTAATPDFNIDGDPFPAQGDYQDVCINNIKMNAGNTSCESKYFISIQESDKWWHRTYEYEWNAWFVGEAPNNINLQNLTSMYSVAPWFQGTDPSRMGDILYGGILSTGNERYYRVNVCTAEPNWTCKSALIKVDPNCKSPDINDKNTYAALKPGEILKLELDKDIYVRSDVEYVKEDKDGGDADGQMAERKSADLVPTNIQISPNPFKDYTTITLRGVEEQKTITVELFNTLGQRVKLINTQENEVQIYRENLLSGIYFFKISTTDEILKSGKLMIE